MLEEIKNWVEQHPTATNIIEYTLWIVSILLAVAWIRRYLKKKLPDNSVKYKTQKGVEISGYFLVVLVSVSFFTGNIKDFGLALGFLTAGITITLQELILSIAGSFYIFFVRVYKPGDRIEINGIKGDVIDIDSIYTTMMEIGEWVSSDNYSGRIVKLSNSFVFKGPVYNYSQDFPFVWDEFNLPIRYGSDLEIAKSIVIGIAQEKLSAYVNASIEEWKAVVSKYYIENAVVEPTLAITLTDNWIQFNLRYIVDYKKRRVVKNELNQEIAKRIEKSEGKVSLASATFEIVNIPTVKLGSEDKRSSKS